MAARRALGSGRSDMLAGEDVIVSIAIAAFVVPREIRIGHDGGDAAAAAHLAGRSALVLPTATTPIQTDAVVTGLAALDAVGAHRLLFAALDLASLARPAPCPRALLRRHIRVLLLGSRHLWG